ncbi:hypothetical protein HanPI659440_Chr12g0472311 [Helianthus annuus]|nr:hypothetical protein HanHA300_Chr12g0455091 [Helianthus annuus]KAJ0494601.1 hypothetical protein HanIR_Chr12g0599331 [Helianthus annuus]KAJ0506322.1 hypothetical protein HanHA89_Chr12g0480671 [Helianthus annuus]KAJ0675995.1 hypothetical protein HanLR1_Chr12g0457601 [Helianthus annuus]KAJ0679241.1 hypothetical protein HanOQP8_Chr12g0457161 [Helianthus annuus]
MKLKLITEHGLLITFTRGSQDSMSTGSSTEANGSKESMGPMLELGRSR